MASIGLCMIVRDEGHILERCLASVAPLIDFAVVVDTGSTDNTRAVASSFFHRAGIAFELAQEAWRDFAANRTSALERLRRRSEIDYAMMIDADEVLVYRPGFDAQEFKRRLNLDVYDVGYRYGGSSYFRPSLLRNSAPLRFRGKVHEFVMIPDGASRGTVAGFTNWPLQDSARNKSPDKMRRDAMAIEQALQQESDPLLIARYYFYLAQNLRECGEKERALAAYRRRSEMGGWDQEVGLSLLWAARLSEQLGRGDEEVLGAYLRSFNACPSRIEALHGAARDCRARQRYHSGYLFAAHAKNIDRPETGLFVEHWIYDFGLLDEFSICAYWTGRYGESLDACVRLLEGGRLPAQDRPRVIENKAFSEGKLQRSR